MCRTVGEGARLTNRKSATRAELTFAQEAWHHAQAFEEKKEPKKQPAAAKQQSGAKEGGGGKKSKHQDPENRPADCFLCPRKLK